MLYLQTLLIPPLLALALCVHLGYTFAWLALPPALRPYAPLLTPLAGCALFLVIAAALTTLTPLTPPWIAAGLAVLALPLNIWTFIRTKNKEQRTNGDNELLFSVLCSLFAGLVFVLAILPPLRWGFSAPIGSNWDAAEFYVPLGRALQLSAQRDLALLPRNPLVQIFSIPPMSGRLASFSYLHAAISSAAGVEPLRSYTPIMAFTLALQPLAVYPLARVLGLGRGAALLATALLALAWLPLWVAYNSFSNHLMALPLLPIALASSLVALRCGGRRALITGGLFTAGLATAYYPAITAYLALLGPAALYLLLARRPLRLRSGQATTDDPRDKVTRRQGDKVTEAEVGVTVSPLHPVTVSGPSVVSGRWSVVRRGLALGALAFVMSGAAQAYSFLRDSFLNEMLRSGGGFQVNSYVSLPDALGLAATFNRESLPGDARLVGAAAGLALLLGVIALAGRRVPLLAALAAGALFYQGYTVARAYHYGFYKGVTFEVPLYAMLIAAGATLLWDLAGRHATTRIAGRVALATGLALILGLNAYTVWGVQQQYAAGGPQLWSATEIDVADVRAEVPQGAAVLVVPPDGHAPTFNSLISYALLGNELSGRFKTGYDALDALPEAQTADLALLPETADPASFGYQAEEVRWAGAGLRLYGRNPGVHYHRALGEGGRYPTIEPGATLALRLGPEGIALPGEATPAPGPPGTQRLTLALASFAPTTIEVSAGGPAARYDLPGGLVELTSDPLAIPGEVMLRNSGDAAAYLWWGELRDPGATAGVAARDEVFLRALAQPSAGPDATAELQLHTQALPEGRQKLTGLLTIAHTAGNQNDWQEVGRWVFFPSGAQPLRLDADLAGLTMTLTAGGQPADLFGTAQAAGDGEYQMALLLANNAKIIYATTLWTWRVRDGRFEKITPDAVLFDIVPLPRPATPLQHDSQDGTIRLRGYTMPRHKLRPGETFAFSLVWQSTRKVAGDLRARVTLADGQGRLLAEQTLALGAPEHGTGTWQEGEIAEQSFALALNAGAPLGPAALSVELIGPDGQPRPFAESAGPLKLAGVEVIR